MKHIVCSSSNIYSAEKEEDITGCHPENSIQSSSSSSLSTTRFFFFFDDFEPSLSFFFDFLLLLVEPMLILEFSSSCSIISSSSSSGSSGSCKQHHQDVAALHAAYCKNTLYCTELQCSEGRVRCADGLSLMKTIFQKLKAEL